MLSEYDLDRPIADGIMIWLEVSEDNHPNIEDTSLEVLSKVAEIYDGRIFGIVFGDIELKPLYKEAFLHGVDTLYHVRSNKLKFDIGSYGDSIKEIVERVNPSVLMMSATERGNELATLLADMLGSTVSLDLRELTVNEISVSGTNPKILTVRPGSFSISEPIGNDIGTVIYWQYKPRLT